MGSGTSSSAVSGSVGGVMGRIIAFPLLALIAIGATLFGGGRLAAAPGADFANHPAIGSWRVQRDPEISNYPLELMSLSADGTALDFGAYGTTGVGVWKPTGAASAVVSFTFVTDGPAYVVIRSSLSFAPDGQSFTGTFTTEAVFDPAHGGTSGEIGPGKVDGTRMAAEGPGTPVASFAEFFPNPAATPEATPLP